MFEKHKQEIISSLNPAEQQQTLAREALEKLDVHCREITDQQASLQEQIHKSSQQLHEIIDLRERELTNKLNYITQEKACVTERTNRDHPGPAGKLSRQGEGDLLNRPWGIALNQSGEVVVTSPAWNCVSVFNPSGDKLRSFGTEGSGQRQFMRPHGVAVDDEGNILVADSVNHRIHSREPLPHSSGN